ncbi:hypothetical protein IRJ41_006706 [Triplophysa rosa]|uniref:Uncharacterized protein n=1 Tax=Triplophysa rosa TaxID=992332 RepID=A0A9W7WLY5_TRIRA|nr:hypothetical protein IRJ41_006706 [Triplophysa rosa]
MCSARASLSLAGEFASKSSCYICFLAKGQARETDSSPELFIGQRAVQIRLQQLQPRGAANHNPDFELNPVILAFGFTAIAEDENKSEAEIN